MTMPVPARRAALAAAALLALLPTAAMADGPLDAYLPKSGKIVGHVMSFEVAPEDREISRRFQAAVQKNMDWFKKAMTGNKAGAPLPYDKRMGVTPAQYEQILHMKADFKQGAPIEIDVQKGGDGTITFASSAEAAKALTEAKVPPDEKAIDTPFGKLATFNEIHQKDANAPIGVWNGVEWAKVEEPDAEQPSAKIAFGKRDPSGEGVMYYQIAPYQEHKEQSLVVFYKLD